MRVYGQGDLAADIIKGGLCIGCGACVKLCPYMQSYKGKTAVLFSCTQSQGRCFAYCPKIEVDLDLLHRFYFNSQYTSNPYGEWQNIHSSRSAVNIESGNIQAGGTVSTLVSFALDRGYLDAAVLTDREGAFPAPRFVTQSKEVLKCASSKYSAAPTLSALNEAVEKGFHRIGIVATPCQATAVAQMRTNPLQDRDFKDPVALVIGLFCTWALDPRAFERFLSDHAVPTEIRKMDIPPPPAEVMEVETGGEKLIFPLEKIRPLVPASCSYCPDMTSEFSDVSVGVLEGRPDWNILLIRTERGKKLVEEAVQAGCLVLEDVPGENIRHLSWAAGNKKTRAFAKLRKEGRLNSTGAKKAFLRVNKSIVQKVISEKQ